MHRVAVLLGLALIVAGCSGGTGVTLAVTSVAESKQVSNAAGTVNCTPACYTLQVQVDNDGKRLRYLNHSNWQVRWPAGQVNDLLRFEGTNKIDVGGSFLVKVITWSHPERQPERPTELWLYDRDSDAPGARMVAKTKVPGEYA